MKSLTLMLSACLTLAVTSACNFEVAHQIAISPGALDLVDENQAILDVMPEVTFRLAGIDITCENNTGMEAMILSYVGADGEDIVGFSYTMIATPKTSHNRTLSNSDDLVQDFHFRLLSITLNNISWNQIKADSTINADIINTDFGFAVDIDSNNLSMLARESSRTDAFGNTTITRTYIPFPFQANALVSQEVLGRACLG